jgi:hypothetical protein
VLAATHPRLVEQARSVLWQALAGNTRSTYKSAVNHLAGFCRTHKLTLTFPVDGDTLCLWMASSLRKLSFASMRVYLHGVATAHVELGFDSPIVGPRSLTLWRMFRGMKRIQGAHAARRRLPMTTTILQKLEAVQDVGSLTGACVRAAMWLATCGLLRSGEVAYRTKGSIPLLRKDLSFHAADESELTSAATWASACYMKLHVAASKTDPFRQGVDVIVSNDKAMAAMLSYLQLRGPTHPEAVLLATTTGDAAPCLTVAALVSSTQGLLDKAGVIDSRLYLGHSFRKGGATSLHEAGMPDSLIKTMGRWLSFAFASYVHTSQQLVIKAGRAMTCARVLGRKVTFDAANVMTWD